MTTREQIQQEIQTLPQDALDLVAQFIQLLKKVALSLVSRMHRIKSIQTNREVFTSNLRPQA